MLIVIPGSVQLREASGNPNEIQNGSYLNCSFRNCTKGLYYDENVNKYIYNVPNKKRPFCKVKK